MQDGIPSPKLVPFAASAAQVVAELETSAEKGLTTEAAARQRSRYGPNALAEVPPPPWWKKLLGQFNELMIWILVAAAIISGMLGEWIDTAAILAIVVLNGVLGFLQEERAERALAALEKLSAPIAKVIRGGAVQSIAARELVPGDVVQLEAGHYIPADVRLLESISFQVQESALTGESTPVEKDAGQTLAEATPLGDRANMAYLGTVAVAGKARAVVTATGMQTELGHIAGLLQRHKPEPTPLQRRLAELGKTLVGVCLLLVGVIFVLQLLRGGPPLEVLLMSVSLAVAAVPEGLPAVVTVALALGVQRMVKRNAIVRKLPSVETLGSVTVICSDKTGTLTRNEMTVRQIAVAERSYRVSGAGYSSEGEFFADDDDAKNNSPALDPQSDSDLIAALEAAARCNDAQFSATDGQAERLVGDPTEGALLVAARKARVEPQPSGWRRVAEIPFDSQRKLMTVVLGDGADHRTMYTKGAPEIVLSNCASERTGGDIRPLAGDRRAQLMVANVGLANRALRVLAVAYREVPTDEEPPFAEAGLIFAGLFGIVDPPREEAKVAVQKCRAAGIRPVMITGDHPSTALAIARELGIAEPDGQAISGVELNQFSPSRLAAEVENISVFARVSAEHKLRIVEAWKARGQIVAMTGDGVNDAPAIKAAHIGIAMGITGTDVTKDASDMVLTDDNFASIVNAVEEGRSIFYNIQKFVLFLLSCNSGEVLFMFFAALIGWPMPLAAIQVLWINLVTDGLPALALAMEPPEPNLMQQPPRPPREPVITRQSGLVVLFQGLLVALATAIGFWLTYQGDDSRLAEARTVAFGIMAYSQLFLSFACRSRTYTLPQLGLFSNPYLLAAIAISGLLQLGALAIPAVQPVFQVTPIEAGQWIMPLALSLAPATVIEVIKIIRHRLKQ